MKTIIIDDEKEAREVLKQLLKNYCPSIELIGEATNGEQGLRLIRELKPELVFLDVEMPEKDGFQVLDSLDSIDFALVFVTAYNQYAVRAFDFSAIAYLLKPISHDRLIRAVVQAQEHHYLKHIKESYKLMRQILSRNGEEDPPSRIAFRNQEEVVFVHLRDLIRIEADGNSCLIFALGQRRKIFVSKNIGYYEDLFANISSLIRVHRGHMVNVDHVKRFLRVESCLIVPDLNGSEDKVPVANGRRDGFWGMG